MKVSEYLKILDAQFGVSGHEVGIRNLVSKLMKNYCTDVYTDTLGNVIGIKKGTNPAAPSLMIEAHMDELGLMVSDITDDGSIKFVPLGGFDPKILTGTEVTIWGKEKLFGVIGAVPPHLISESNKSSKLSELCVDAGLSADKAKSLIEIGDIITINTFYTELMDEFVAARCIDDRGGLAIVLRALEILSAFELENDIIAVATVQEEVGLRGAKTAAAHIKPGCAIAIDVCHGTSPGVSEDAFPCGKGPVLTVGPNLHTKMTRKLIELAKRDSIDIQLEACRGDTGTDAWEIQVSGAGVPTSLISVPLRYMHSNYEVCSTNDLESAAKLISTFATQLKEGGFLCW